MSQAQLFSVLIHLRATAAGQINSFAGYLAHAAFLDLLRQVDPALSQTLHNLNQRKPFTLSSLLDLENGIRQTEGGLKISPSRLYQLRLTSLSPEIFNTFTARFFSLDSSQLKVRVGEMLFQVVRIEGSGDSHWVGRNSFEQLAEAPQARAWTFQFASPTAFSLGEQDWGGRKFNLFPDPGNLFDSLAGGWNDFAPEGFLTIDKSELRQYVEKYLVVSGYHCQTELIQFKQHQQLGFTGQVSYKLMEKQPSPTLLQTLNRLAALALYTGVGYKTTMGMGQVRCMSLTKYYETN
ncbi:MAG: CRISPR-associated endoribonuclease Cas6 [Chloroflexi bacterium]|uniref:CRISPR-associated endoribonuclease Cas6 n=1 Tax=Candidatus Chlorohelix allophototropha TaxID=3003348 RepID=A0A8T7M4R3_9CHLR|nr:CRISPR-associated endoribonuclease Cas6 [Chloroflexota bacterium]WJW70373.1 CRISPR-associated endoribonuclease Cas6 [Chloroflexota bacterium L227-S17]